MPWNGLFNAGGCGMHETENIRAALRHIPAYDREIWLRIGMAIKSELGEEGFDL
jgi:putative DNA primase/helicase